MSEHFSRPTRPLAVDLIVFNEAGELLLIQRRDPPFQGCYALPGGMVDLNETAEEACRREVMEEVGLDIAGLPLAWVGLYSAPARDPKRQVISAAYMLRMKGVVPQAGDDAASAAFYADWQSKDMAFDHKTILEDAMRLGRKAA